MDAPDIVALAGLSPTLVPSLAGYGLGAVLSLVAAAALFIVVSRRRRSVIPLRHFHADQSGVAVSVDLILVAVPFIIFVTLLVQMSWLMRETIIVHYAAYAAARSAKVHECPMIPTGPIAGVLVARDLLCTSDQDQQALAAARFALISAAPPWDIACMGSCRVPEQVLRTITDQGGLAQRSSMVVRQAQYAFDPPNVRLTISTDLETAFLAGQMPFDAGVRPAVEAELIYRHHILRWVGPLLGTRRGDGDYFRLGRAVVRLL